MPWSPVNVTQDGPGRNPWLDASDSIHNPVLDVETKLPAAKSVKPPGSSCYTRSQTSTGHPLHSVPLASDDQVQNIFGRRASLDLHETRPSLRRAINASRKTFEGERPASLNGGCPNGQGERKAQKQVDTEVIVHQIQPGDSLPGVALKYNISLATLRSANKLWASDSIHLRQVLHIPIQAVSTATAKSVPNSPRTRPDLPSHPVHSAPEVTTRTSSRMRRSASEWTANAGSRPTRVTHASAAHTISAGATSTIRRVPLSELSFFPPPSTSALSPQHDTGTHFRPQNQELPSSPSKIDAVGISPSRFPNLLTRGTPPFALTNFLNGAKDEIISRLSFDSARGSSDAGEEHDVELDVVRPGRRVRRRSSDGIGDRDHAQEFISKSNGTTMELHPVTGRESVILNTPRKPKVVRTMQLQPSPKMVIPARSAVGKTTNGTGSPAIHTDAN